MKFTYITALLLFFSSCVVDKVPKPALQNEVKQFSFIKMELAGDTIHRNFSYYWSDFSYWPGRTDKSLFMRGYEYSGYNGQQLPYENYFDKMSKLTISFNTRNELVAKRIGKTMPVSHQDNRYDNYFDLEMTYFGSTLLYKYSEADSVTYVNVKDTVIAQRNYELSHLLFDQLILEDINGVEYVARNVELRQVIN